MGLCTPTGQPLRAGPAECRGPDTPLSLCRCARGRSPLESWSFRPQAAQTPGVGGTGRVTGSQGPGWRAAPGQFSLLLSWAPWPALDHQVDCDRHQGPSGPLPSLAPTVLVLGLSCRTLSILLVKGAGGSMEAPCCLFPSPFKTWSSRPGWCGSVGWASSCKVKGHQFDSQSRHKAGFRVRSPVRVHMRSN